jgi:hypothetical protein
LLNCSLFCNLLRLITFYGTNHFLWARCQTIANRLENNVTERFCFFVSKNGLFSVKICKFWALFALFGGSNKNFSRAPKNLALLRYSPNSYQHFDTSLVKNGFSIKSYSPLKLWFDKLFSWIFKGPVQQKNRFSGNKPIM